MRQGRSFTDIWASLAEEIDYSVEDLAAAVPFQTKMLSRFNKAYGIAYDMRSWEDAWSDDELTPENRRFLSWSAVEDSRAFELWTADPRESGCACEVPFTTTAAGITLQGSYSTVYGFWKPPAIKFTLTAYAAGTNYAVDAVVMASDGHNYKCIQAGTGQNPVISPAYWTKVPVLDVLGDEVVEMACARHLISTGRFDEGNLRMRIAQGRLDQAGAAEWARLAKQKGRPWRPVVFS